MIFNFPTISNQLHKIGVIHTIPMCQKSAFRLKNKNEQVFFCSKQMKDIYISNVYR